MLQQSAEVGMVILQAGRGPGELGHEGLVQQEAFGQGCKAGSVKLRRISPRRRQVVDLDGPEGGEIVGIDFIPRPW